MDVISSFLSDCCTIGEGEIQSQKLYNAYCGWADDNGEYKMSHTNFARELQKREHEGIKRKVKNSGKFYTGISLISDFNFSVNE